MLIRIIIFVINYFCFIKIENGRRRTPIIPMFLVRDVVILREYDNKFPWDIYL